MMIFNVRRKNEIHPIAMSKCYLMIKQKKAHQSAIYFFKTFRTLDFWSN